MANGKAKGSEFERSICKRLSLWLTGKEKPVVFWRSPASGGLGTIKTAENVSGDIVSISDVSKWVCEKFSIECKNGYPSADLFKHIKNNIKNDEIEQFWEQCIRDSRTENKHGILVFKKKGNQPIIGIEKSVYGQLIEMSIDLNKCIILHYDNDLPPLVLLDFDDFLNKVKPLHIKNIS